MPDYKNSSIYKLECKNTGKIYIGSTTNYHKRIINHRSIFNTGNNIHNITSTEVLKGGNWIDDILEKYPCNTKKELMDREDYYIKQYDCVNISSCKRTKSKLEVAKEWQKDNRKLLNLRKRNRNAWKLSFGKYQGKTQGWDNNLLDIKPCIFS
tara:strand:- start:45 stop:503 length:459 start_codon:yes stop_codon:yes gene_type:complete